MDSLGPPSDLSGPEALEALRVSSGYMETPTMCPLGSFDPAAVSLPSEGMSPVPLEMLWGSGGRSVVEDFTFQRMLCPEAVKSKLEESGVERVYQDPAFHNPKTYAGFVQRLHELGLVEYSLEKSREEVGLFFVKKKNNKLRLIMDCRRSNCHFEEPQSVQLATGDALSRIEVEEGAELFMASADLQNAFYTMGMPEALRPWFGLRRLKASVLGVTEVGGVKVSGQEWLYPRIKVIPMGWSWALWWCQRVNERICERSGLDEARRLRDGAPFKPGTMWRIQYVDNLHIIGTDKAEVEKHFWAAVQGLREAGLTVHEVEVGDGASKMLGWEVEARGVLRPTRERVWRIRTGLREILKRGRASGRQIERLVGHMTFVSLCRRESLSVLGEVYTFIRRNYDCIAPLWKSVRRELLKWDGICPLIFTNFTRPWSQVVYSVDASEWGLGVVSSEMDRQEVQRLGLQSERWRFKDSRARDPRQYVLDEDHNLLLANGNGEIGTSQVAGKFETVGFWAVDRAWHVVGRYKWRKHDSMPVYEAMSTLYAMKHALRSVNNHGKRHIILTDSMTAAVAFTKGRAHSYRLRGVVEQASAIQLCTGSQFRSRWVPSEWNTADSISRGGFVPSIPCRRFDDPQAAECPSNMGNTQGEPEEAQEAEHAGGQSMFSDRAGGSSDLGHRTRGRQVGKQEEPSIRSQKTAAAARAREHLAPGLGEQTNPEEVQGDLEPIHPVEWAEGQQPNVTAGFGSSCDSLSGGDVSGRGRLVQGELLGGSDSFLCAPMQRFGSSPSQPTVHEGLEEALPAKKPHATPLRGGVPPSSHSLQTRVERNRHDPPFDLLSVPPAFGGLQAASSGSGGASQQSKETIQELFNIAASHRVGGSLQDPPVGRDDGARPRTPEVLGDCPPKALEAEVKTKTTTSLHCQSHRGERLCEQSVEAFEAPSVGGSSSLQASTRGSLFRRGNETSHFARDTKQRSVADHQEREELRERVKVESVVRKSVKRHTTGRNQSPKRHRKRAPQPALGPGVSLAFAVFLEIFSGSGRLGHAVARHCNWPVLLWNIDYGEQYDLTKRPIQQMVLHWIRSGKVRAGHLGTPCNSFSRARDRPGGPPRLRSDEHPMGLPGLADHLYRKIHEGNVLMRFSCAVLRLAISFGLPFTMENPHRSRLWICPPVLQILRRRVTVWREVHFCAFGTPWKKPTRILGVHLSLDLLDWCKCVGSKRGVCKFSGTSHIPLAGQDSSGRWMTKVAEPYPRQLTKLMATAFANEELSLIATEFSRFL